MLSFLASKSEITSSAIEGIAEKVAIASDRLVTNLMIADTNGVIVYLNDSVKQMLKKCEPEIRKQLPNFSADNVIGKTFDIFHKNPAHQRHMVEGMKDLLKTSIIIGDYVFNLLANPLFDGDGKRIGTAVEWIDDTAKAQVEALSSSQAVIEFHLDGTIIHANPLFLQAVGYRLEEIKGKHHSLFVAPEYAAAPSYKEFWAKLNRGESVVGEFQRFGKGGKEIWLQASYNAIMGLHGKPVRVIKYASDITATKLASADAQGQINAIGKSQAVIAFNMDGTIITANDNFLNAVGYTLPEIQGKHHRMFVEPQEAESPQYAQFWEKLNRGEYDARVYKRIGKGGKEVWIQASYNPILDMNGRPFKVVKYATDVTNIIKTGEIAEQAVANMQSVAAAVEEMTASISEISKNMVLSKDAASVIMNDTTQSSAAAEQLTGSMKSMENVVQLINNIASQVNLLALNATIEAARAGEAGKGFAVVAAEVKNLANQTAKATGEIAKQINDVQAAAITVTNNVKNIAGSASNVSEYVTGVASAIEEQSAVISEISHNTQRMSSSVKDISQRIKSLSNVS